VQPIKFLPSINASLHKCTLSSIPKGSAFMEGSLYLTQVPDLCLTGEIVDSQKSHHYFTKSYDDIETKKWKKITKLLLAENEWKKLVEILRQFDTVTTTLSGRDFVMLSLVAPLIFFLKKKFLELIEMNYEENAFFICATCKSQ